MGSERHLKQMCCWTCYTNERVHEVLKSGLADSPLFNGQIKSIGPRYCPSIETKLVTFPDKDQHQLFLEPEGDGYPEWYVQGMEDVQWAMYRTIPGLERCIITR